LSKAKLDSMLKDIINSLKQGLELNKEKLFVSRSNVLLYIVNLSTCKELYIIAHN